MTHIIQLERYTARAQGVGPLCLGTADSYGSEQLQLVRGEGWQGLLLSVTFHPPGGTAVRVLADDSGLVSVPPEATADCGYSAPGRIVIAGAADGVLRVSTDLPYALLLHSGTGGEESAGATPGAVEQLMVRTDAIQQTADAAAQTAARASADTAAFQTALDQLSLSGSGLGFAGGYLDGDGCLRLTDAAGSELSSALYTPIYVGGGAAGGYYTPAVSQPDASTLRLDFTASQSSMAAVPSQTVTLPAGPQGEPGEKGEKGDTGDTGATPQLMVGTVTTLAAGSSATASIVGTAASPVLNLGIPRGADGADGAAGSGTAVPDYLTDAAAATARALAGHQSRDSFLFAFLADGHCGLYTDPDNDAVTQAGQALRAIDSRCPLDLVVHGGDLSTGAWDTTADAAFTHVEDYTALTALQSGVPTLWCVGNHDDAPYQATDGRLTQTQTYTLFGRRNLRAGAVCPAGANYGYLDFENRRLRVILLDTDDKRALGSVQVGAGETAPAVLNAQNVGPAQLQWLADTALDFSGKADPAAWAVVVVSHAPLDISGTGTDPVSGESFTHSTANAAAILGGYVRGESGSLTHQSTVVTYAFAAQPARAQVWCLVHGHQHRFTSQTLQGILSIGCPNLCNGRERESDDGVTYTKTAGTAQGTAFCLLTVDRQNDLIRADCFGAGIDRQWSYTPVSGTAAYTNLLPSAIDTDGSVYNGIGYLDGHRLGSDGSPVSYDGYAVTGFMPCAFGDFIYLSGVTLVSGDSNQRLSFYDADFNHLAQTNGTGSPGTLEAVFGEDGSMTQFKVQSFGGVDLADVAWFRLNAASITAASVITRNETIA